MMVETESAIFCRAELLLGDEPDNQSGGWEEGPVILIDGCCTQARPHTHQDG